MKIAILMSTYNGQAYLDTQIQFILAQQGDFQADLWVRDDGSADETKAILQRYADDGKLRWFTGENLRPAKSFLTLLQQCPGYDYYAFADQDDVWDSDKLAAGIASLKQDTAPALYFANARLVDKEQHSLGRNVYTVALNTDFYSLCCNGGLLGCTMVFNSALAKLVQDAPIPENLVMHDFYLAVLCRLYNGNIYYDAEPRMDYRQHGGNVVGSQWSKWGALKDRLQDIFTPCKISVADQASSILACYPQAPCPERIRYLQKIADYRCSLWRAMGLAFSKNLHFSSKNKAITTRLSILMRHR